MPVYEMSLHITQLNIYPIKSTAGISVPQANVARIGLQQDRRYMLVDAQGRYLTARQQPKLLCVHTRVDQLGMTISAEGQDDVFLGAAQTPYQQGEVSIWRDRCIVDYVGKIFDQWFSSYLGMACHLVKLPTDDTRKVDQNFGQASDFVSFADGFPLLLISQASLDDLNQRLPTPVSMARFRPNIVVSGCAAYAEDTWQQMQIGDVGFRGVKNCTRCTITTIDPSTGIQQADKQPLKTLREYRHRPGGVYFGQNIIPDTPGKLCVGDLVQV